MMTWLLAQVPFWVWVTLTLLGTAAILWFLHPILLPLWAATPKPVKMALGVVGAFIGTYLFALNRGSRAERERQKQREIQANTKREELHREVEKRDSTTIDRDFDKWVR